MRTWKLVAGILSIVLTLVVMLQSCAAGIGDALEAEGGTSGASGTIVAILMLAGGIVSIVTRNSQKKGGNIALVVLFGIAALFGYTSQGIFEDLMIWATWCLINAILALIAMTKNSGKVKNENNEQV